MERPRPGISRETRTLVLTRADGRCESPFPCTDPPRSIDHFTPVSIARALGWTREQINDPANLQALCDECHTLKDADTRLRLIHVQWEQVREHPLTFTLEQHIKLFLGFAGQDKYRQLMAGGLS